MSLLRRSIVRHRLIQYGATAVLLLIFTPARAAEPLARVDPVVERLVKAYNAEDYPGTRADYNAVMAEALPADKSDTFFRNLRLQCGKIVKRDPGRYTPPGTAVYRAQFDHAVLDIKIVLDDQDKIAGLWFLPPVAAIPAPDRNKKPLALPFRGAWFTHWGGDTKELNHHHDVPSQKFAFDFLVRDDKGSSFAGDGAANEDYYCFDKEILAPANGTVTDCITGVSDNSPGSMNPFSALGNAVFIRHARYEVSVLAHLRRGSIRVKVGDSVKKGDVLARCGNSGNSSEPHLHYHLMNTTTIQDATGIKCFFDNVLVTTDGEQELKEGCSPVKGDTIATKE